MVNFARNIARYSRRKSTKRSNRAFRRGAAIAKAPILPIFSRDKNVLRTSFPWCNHAERESIVGKPLERIFPPYISSGTACKSDKIYPARCTPPRATSRAIPSLKPVFDHSSSTRSTLFEIYNRNSSRARHFPRPPMERPLSFLPSLFFLWIL